MGSRARWLLAAVPLAAVCALAWNIGRPWPPAPVTAGVAESLSWRPTPEEIARRIGPGGGDVADDRHRQFARLFERRYRDKQQAVAVRFVAPDRIRLACAASMAPWEKAHLAVQVLQEAEAAFGTRFGVDILDTYIGARRRKVAEVRHAATGDGGAQG